MTAVTIHPGGAAMSATAKHLVALAGGDSQAVRAVGTGLTVSPELAYRYLAASLNGHAPTDVPRPVVPPGLAEAVRVAEDQAGVANEETRARARAAAATTRTTRTRKTTTKTAPEE